MKTIASHLARLPLAAFVALTALIGILTGLAPMLPAGDLRPDGYHAEIVHRFDDFENYGWHRAEHTEAAIHPVYAAVVAANRTLPALIAAFGRQWTRGDVVARLTVFLLLFAAFGIAAPLLVFSLTNSKPAAMLTAFAMAALDWKDLTYVYNNSPYIGSIATSLSVIELALIVMKRPKTALAIWLVHLVTHPTTAVVWLFPLLAFAALLGGDRPYLRERKWHYIIIAAAPVALAGALIATEKAGLLFSGVDYESYWAIIRVRTLHTLFLNTERSLVLVLYAQLCLALAVLGWSSRGEPRLNLLNRVVSAFGLGMLVTSLAMVETQTSVSFAALLPLRYSNVMFVVLIVNLVSILLGQRSPDWGCRFMAAAVFSLLLIGHGVNPLFAIGLWAVGQRFAEQGLPPLKLSLALASIATLSVGTIALLPTTGNVYSSWYLKPWMKWSIAERLVSGVSDHLSIPAINAQYAVLFAHDTFIIFVLVMVGLYLRRPFLAKAAVIVTTVFAVVPVIRHIAAFPYRTAAAELPIALGIEPNRNDPSAELMTWLQTQIPSGDGVLGYPNLFFRRKLAARVSVDDDLLSLVPYVPATSAAVVDEYRRLYAVDFVDLAKRHRRVGEAIDDAAWNTARQRVLTGQIPEYKWVVEAASQKPAGFPISFENAGYRVYSRGTAAR